VARFQTFSGAQHWANSVVDPFAAYFVSPTGVLTTIFAKDGITLGLVHDTAATTLRYQTGEEDPSLGWHLDLCWGTEDSPDEQGILEEGFGDSDGEESEDEDGGVNNEGGADGGGVGQAEED